MISNMTPAPVGRLSPAPVGRLSPAATPRRAVAREARQTWTLPVLLLVLLLATTDAEELVGFYSWNWGSGSTGPAGANVGVAFTGLVDLGKAVAQYTPGAAWCCPPLDTPSRLVCVGGGNSAGTFTPAAIDAIARNVSLAAAANYTGILFDVEQVKGPASATAPAFRRAFAAAKRAGLTVGVTTSHSAPYDTDTPQDAIDLVKAWVADPNVDILSPQLYSSGSESAPEFAETSSCVEQGCLWSLYDNFRGSFAPSIVEASQFATVQQFFAANTSVRVDGFVQWKQQRGGGDERRARLTSPSPDDDGDGNRLALASYLASHMVVQHSKPWALVGTDAPGARVNATVTGDGKTFSTVADAISGRWRLDLPARPPTTDSTVGVTVSISSSSSPSVVLEDVLFGELYVCSGQSNMQLAVIDTNNSAFEIARAGSHGPGLRILQVALEGSNYNVTAPQANLTVDIPWGRPSPANVAGMSAVCYYFGVERITRQPNMPVGMIASSWGGTAIEVWMDPAALASCGVGSSSGPSDDTTSDVLVEVSIDPGLGGAVDAGPPTIHSTLWNSMLAPLASALSVEGFLWYQVS